MCAIDAFTKYTWVNPLTDEKAKTGLYGFIETVNESKRKPNKLWVNQGKGFYNKLTQKWYNNIDDNNDMI